jgi:hypothetical protein
LKFDEAMDALHGGSVHGVHPKTRWQFQAGACVGPSGGVNTPVRVTRVKLTQNNHQIGL